MTSSHSPPTFWPYGIMLAFAVFIAGTVVLIGIATSNRMDLVSADYYEREIRYQEQIDRAHRSSILTHQSVIAYDPALKTITITLPAAQPGQLTGRIQLYRPSAARLDREIALEPDPTGAQKINTTDLAPGLWDVLVHWKIDNREFFCNKRVVI